MSRWNPVDLIDERGYAWCSECKSYRPPQEFAPCKFTNPKCRRMICRACKAKRDKPRRMSRKIISWRRLYGITEQEYWAVYDKQGGVCAICGRTETKLVRGQRAMLHVDHDHKAGLIRGLLCSTCNTAIGMLQDNSEVLRKAADYLDLHRPL